MDNLFEGGIAELEQAKLAVIEEADKSYAADQAADALKAKEKEIEEENRAIEEKIQEVLKSKKAALTDPLDQEVERTNNELKESLKKRSAAKEVAVNRRISSETAIIEEEISQREHAVKTMYRNAGMPAFCRKGYYSAMYAPADIADYAIFIISALVAFLGIPVLVISLVDTTIVGKIFLYIAIVAFFCLIYLAVFFWTQPGKKRSVLEEARPEIDKIHAAKKEIKRLTKSIRNDKDESGYGLEEIDNEIVRNRGIYDDAIARRDAALKEFEEQIRPSVRQEVAGARAEEMNKLTAERDFLKQDFEQKQQEAKITSQRLNQNYGTYLGKKNLDPDRIDQLIGIMRDGKAGNILGALDVLKEESRITNRIAGATGKMRPETEKYVQDISVSRAEDTVTVAPAPASGFTAETASPESTAAAYNAAPAAQSVMTDNKTDGGSQNG